MVGGWSYDIEGSVVVWNFRKWYARDRDDVEEVLQTFRDVTAYPTVRASVVLLGDGGAIDSDTFDLAESYLDVYRENDIEKVAFVSSDIKGLAMKNVLNDAPEVDVHVTDDRDEALEWAHDRTVE